MFVITSRVEYRLCIYFTYKMHADEMIFLAFFFFRLSCSKNLNKSYYYLQVDIIQFNKKLKCNVSINKENKHAI